MSCSQHTCTSRCCNDDSHNTSPHGGQEITAKEYLKYVAAQEQIRNEQRQAAKKALRIALKNKRNTRVGQATNQFHLDSSGNTIQVQASRRAFIMEHLAKVQLAKSLGMEDKVPTLKSVLESYGKSQPTKVQPVSEARKLTETGLESLSGVGGATHVHGSAPRRNYRD